MADVTLSAAVRSSLLSLKDTTDLINRTQSRLSTGLRVASAIDDPVSFFQAKTLSDRAGDLNQKKDGIDQGISSVTAALDAVTSVESIVGQLKGLAQSMKSATSTQFTDLITQFNSLRTQIGNLVTDATYQGTNLVNNTSQSLTVEFSDKTASLLTVNASKLDEDGLSLGGVAQYLTSTTLMANFSANTAVSLGTANMKITYKGNDITLTETSSVYSFSVGTATVNVVVGSGATLSLTQGAVYSGAWVGSGVSAAAGSTAVGASVKFALTAAMATAGATTTTSTTGNFTTWISEGDSTNIDVAIAQLDSSLTTLRAQASSLGSNVALLQTRFDFTDQYVSTLENGASKLTIADINQEGANLLALQTRQQLGITALSFAGQAEQSILGLFG